MTTDDILSKFFCYVLRRHVWKRAVRQSFSTLTGTQTCRWCGKTRLVTLRKAKAVAAVPELVRTPTPEPVAAQRSQWP